VLRARSRTGRPLVDPRRSFRPIFRRRTLALRSIAVQRRTSQARPPRGAFLFSCNRRPSTPSVRCWARVGVFLLTVTQTRIARSAPKHAERPPFESLLQRGGAFIRSSPHPRALTLGRFFRSSLGCAVALLRRPLWPDRSCHRAALSGRPAASATAVAARPAVIMSARKPLGGRAGRTRCWRSYLRASSNRSSSACRLVPAPRSPLSRSAVLDMLSITSARVTTVALATRRNHLGGAWPRQMPSGRPSSAPSN